MTLTPRLRTALWVGSGAFLGVLVGGFVTNQNRAEDLVAPWLVLFALFLGAIAFLARRKPEPKAAPAPERRIVPTRDEPLALRVGLVDIPDGHPPVLGVDEPLRVRLSVTARGELAAGAAVRLAGHLRDGAKSVAADGVAGADGTVEFSLKAPGVGELLLDAEASLGDLRGATRSSVSVVRYEEEIQRLFAEFRAYAHGALGPESSSDTARELAEKLRAGADPQTGRALLELARIYELVAYGERDAGRALYLQLIGALLVLERAPDRPSPAAAAAPTGG